MFIKRDILPKLEAHLEDDEVLVLTGFRRVGKSTLIKYIFDKLETKNKIFLDMESPVNQELFSSNNYDAIAKRIEKLGIQLNGPKAYVFLDEVQFVKKIPSIVKYLLDHYKIKFILTGSSSFYLKNHFTESLSGRKFIFELMPLSFGEFLLFKGVNLTTNADYEYLEAFYSEYLEFGGLPGVVLTEGSENKKLKLDDALGSYFQLDVSNLANFNDLQKLRSLLFLLVSRVGSKLDITKIAESVGVSRQTLYNYLEFFEDTYLIHQIPAYSKSSDIVSRKVKKLYFFDSGILNRIGKVSDGQLFENKVFNQIFIKVYAENQIKFLEAPISYFQKKSGVEIDFIALDTGFEVKLNGSFNDLKKISKLSNELKLKSYYIVSKEKIKKTDNHVIYPFDL